jgi:hypothetical protein
MTGDMQLLARNCWEGYVLAMEFLRFWAITIIGLTPL